MSEASEGRPIAPVSRRATRNGLFTYSAVTWNPHRIHLDRTYTKSLGHPDLVVPGALLADWMLQAVHAELGAAVRVRSFAYKALSPTYVDVDLTVGGSVTEEDGDGVATVRTWIRANGEVTMEGTVCVEVARVEEVGSDGA